MSEIETGSPTATSDAPSSQPPSLHEHQTFGDYRIVRLIGRGGMGEVYEADDPSGRRVALKVVKEAKSSPGILQRFLREGQLAASLNHPNTVYVFGSGEADGLPFIVTELVASGTLADRVKTSGPLPVSAAVDAILDVIAGLTAASDVGILHRDVKPSNCFVLHDGSVKIGDFGVSIPRDAQHLTHLTLTGAIVGTPSYCAPEQMRGEPLDVRSDIYSVGATLFYLLIGRPPHRGDNIVQLIEQVVTMMPEAPHRQRPEIPKGLSDVVIACLAKRREQRPASYEALADSLKPFSSASPVPAHPAPRALAALLDALVVILMWNVTRGVLAALLPLPASILRDPLGAVVRLLEGVLYFALMEYWFGASAGKFFCGLRVARADGSRIGLGAAIARASIVMLVISAPMLISSGLPAQTYTRVVPLLMPLAVFLLFVTARQANGYAGLHELLSGSRTWDMPKQRTSPVRTMSEDAASSESSSESIGPYDVVRQFPNRPALVLARDRRLKRLAWIEHSSTESPLSPARRDLDRAERFRWLGGNRTASGWHAYGYVGGKPLAALEPGTTPFHTVAPWLAALGRECRACSADGTLPAVTVNHIWVTHTGQVMIADWPLPETAGKPRSYSTGALASCEEFLSEVADVALGRREARAPLPVYGRMLLRAIDEKRFADFDDLVAACEGAAARDGSLSTERRIAPIVAASVFAAAPLVLVLSQVPQISQLDLFMALRMQLASCLGQLNERGPRGPSDIERPSVEMCVAVASRELNSLPRYGMPADNFDATVLESAQRKYPDLTIADLDAKQAASPDYSIWRLRERITAMRRVVWRGSVTSALAATIRLLGILALISVAFAAMFKEGPLYRILGIAIVDRTGRDCSRARAIARASIAWLPTLVGAALVYVYRPPNVETTWPLVVGALLIGGMAVGAVYAARSPSRGIPELITGTVLVRR